MGLTKTMCTIYPFYWAADLMLGIGLIILVLGVLIFNRKNIYFNIIIFIKYYFLDYDEKKRVRKRRMKRRLHKQENGIIV